MKILQLRGKMPFHVPFSALYISVWFDVVHDIAVDMVFDTSIIDRFSHAILLSKRKAVLLYCHPVSILVLPKQSKASNPASTVFKSALETHSKSTLMSWNR